MTDLCIRCGGSGMYMGNGMIMTECQLCKYGNVEARKKYPPLDKVDRRSKSYNNAISDIMSTSNISRAEAVKVFDETYDKI
jgi:hypothetical protein